MDGEIIVPPSTTASPILTQIERDAAEFDRVRATIRLVRQDEPIEIPEPPAAMTELPPVESYATPQPELDQEELPREAPELAADSAPRYLNWTALRAQQPPEFDWIVPGWLSWHPHLLSGKGGIGKTLLVQQMLTALGTGKPFLGRDARAPLRVLMWACEDDHDELWRRQDRICRSMGIGFDALELVHIDARVGKRNDVLAIEYGRPVLTSRYQILREQIHDLRIDVFAADNIGHLFAGSENDRAMVTFFVNAMAGLCSERPFCPILMGHVAKVIGSEYAGSTAWENAVRGRMWLTDRPPGAAERAAEDGEPDETAGDLRYLCKRKSNYSAQDVIELTIEGGVLRTTETAAVADSGTTAHLINQRARGVVLRAATALATRGRYGSEMPGPSYLPKIIMDNGMAEGLGKADLKRAMLALLNDGSMKTEVVGKYPNRTPKHGLVVVVTAAA